MKRHWTVPDIRCGSCQTRLDVQDEEAGESLVFCDECFDKVEKVKESEEVFWFTSHLDPRHVMRSSHPSLIPLSVLPLSRLPNTPGIDAATAAPSIAAKLAKARRVLIVAGAGMSVDSGLATFRGDEGTYAKLQKKGFDSEHLTFHGSDADTLFTWGYMTTLLTAAASRAPHSGYSALLQMVKDKDYFVFTSNIDSYFLRAGFSPEKVYESHGSLHYLQCTSVGTENDCQGDIRELEEHEIPEVGSDGCCVAIDQLPKCTLCQSLARPNVSHCTDFAEHVQMKRKAAQAAALHEWLAAGQAGVPNGEGVLIIELGCGQSIHSLRGDSEIAVSLLQSPVTRNGGKSERGSKRGSKKQRGGSDASGAGSVTLIRIDPGEASVPIGHIAVQAGAEEVLVAVQKELAQLPL
jgi:NAD-dependent SIR2 family protein deacetylase